MQAPHVPLLAVILLAAGCAVDAPPERPFVNTTCLAAAEPPATLADTGCFEGPAADTPSEGLVAYDVRVPLWSDGTDKQRWLALPEGSRLQVERDGDLTLPVGGVLIKTF